MQKVSRNFIALAGILIGINILALSWIHYQLAKSPKPTTRLISLSVLPNEDSINKLSLTFDRDIVSTEKIGQTEKASILKLTPEWPGEWIWSSPDKIEYSFTEKLPLGRVFRISSTEVFKDITGRTIEGKDEFEFRTKALSLTRTELVAFDERDITFRLVFNQPVDPGELLRHISFINLQNGNKLTEPLCLTQTPQEDLVIRFPRRGTNRFEMVLDEELTGYNAELGLDRKVVRTQDVPRSFSLLSIYAGNPNLDEIVSVELRFSHKLNLEQKLPEIFIKPAIEKYNVSRNNRYLTIAGKFKPGLTYKVEVPGTILSVDDETLGENKSMSVTIPEYQTRFQFEYREGILSPMGNHLLDIKAVNVEGLELEAWRVHANNLISHLQNKYSSEATSRKILAKEIKLDLPHNKPQKLTLDINDLVSVSTGIYRINANVTNSRWTNSSALVTITDLAITSKSERGGSLVWITSLRTGDLVRDVEVKAITYNNQILSSEVTDSNGLARLKYASNNPDGDMWVITAQKGDDIAYIRPGENQWVLDNVDQSGRPFVKNYEVMLYTERGVYRPGETVHLTGIIRGRSGDIPEPFPLEVKVTRPDGRNVAEIIAKPLKTKLGVFHVDFPTRIDSQTGSYRFNVTLPGSDENLGSTYTLVECFIPVRMEVTAETTSDRYGPNEPPMINVSGQYLWDEPAAELPVAVTGTLRETSYRSDRYPDYKFGGKINYQPRVLPDSKTELDANGLTEIQVQLPKSLEAGLYRMQLSATVTETGGRSVSANTSAMLDTLDKHIGIKISLGQVVSVGKPIQVQWVQLNGLDQVITEGQLKMSLVKVEYDTVMKLVNDRRVWQSVERDIQIGDEQIITSFGEGNFEIACTDPGYHRIIITDTDSNSCSSLDFYASKYSAGPQSMPMNQPERLEIVTDKEKYLPGQVATVLIRSPIPGRFLLTVENDNVVSEHLGIIENNTAQLEIPLPQDSRGSIYFSATVIRAIDPDHESWLPHRAMGTARANIDHSQNEIPINIVAPDKAEPDETITVTVETGTPSDPNNPALVHLWAVDEGILLTTSYQTPNPFDFFLGPRRLGVSSSDIFMCLLPDYKRPADITRIGAGDDHEINSLRRNPVPAKVRKSAVIWQEAIPVDKDGKIIAEFKMPDMIGQMRIMAVVIGHDSYVEAEHALILTSPLIAEASWPRFVAPNDEFNIPVKLFNSTESSLNVQLKTTISGPIEVIADEAFDNIILEPGQPKILLLNIIAKKMGAVEADVIVSEINSSEKPLTAHNKGSFTVRPAVTLHSEVKLYSIEAGEQLTIEPPQSFIDGTAYMKVSISARPNVQLGPALQKLINYPYGCVEQTSSKLLSLLYAGDVFADDRDEMVNSMAKAGIVRLWAMQTRSGGLSYWPGGSDAYLWGTAYASSCLLEAQNAGYEIDSQFTSELAKYLEQQLKNTGDNEVDINTKALLCRVLAVFGEPPLGWMARLLEQKEKLDLAGTAHLAAAFNASGRKDNAISLLPEDLPQSFGPTTSSGRLTSPVSQQATMLSVLLEIDPENPIAALLARRLNENGEDSQWGSTLNNATVIAALSRYQVMTSNDDPNFYGAISLSNEEIAQFDNDKMLSHKFENISEPVTISSAGKGKLYIVALSEGLAREGLIQPFDNGIHVERKWSDRHGNPIDMNDLHVGDLINVETTIVAPAQTFHNIAIVDALPGAMEVENPRMATSSNPGDINSSRPDHIEFLDDRVVLFCSVRPRPKTFKYALRVITSGEFSLPPIQASCMYEPTIASLGAESKVIVKNNQ